MSGERQVFIHSDIWNLEEDPDWIDPKPRQFIDDFMVHKRPIDEYQLRTYSCKLPNPEEIDFIAIEGGYGLFSSRFIETIRSYMEECFSTLPAILNGLPFFFLRFEGSIDCLDYDNSDVRYFDSDPDEIMSIKHFSFHTEKLKSPRLFAIPGFFGQVFWTKPLTEICEQAKLKGIRFISIDMLNRCHGWTPSIEKVNEMEREDNG